VGSVGDEIEKTANDIAKQIPNSDTITDEELKEAFKEEKGREPTT
jgi:hypothetical protein